MKKKINKIKKYYFKQHDEGGRVIEIFSVIAMDYNKAYAIAEKRAQEINSHGITYCDANGKCLPVGNNC